MADTATAVVPPAAATTPAAPTLTPQQQEIVQAFRSKYKGAATQPDQKIVQYLSDPTKFRSSFPEYGDLDDSVILHNMGVKPPLGSSVATGASITPAQASPDTTKANSLAQKRLKQAQPGITPAMRSADPTNQKVVSTLKAIPPLAADAAAVLAPEAIPALSGGGTIAKVLKGAASGGAGSGITSAVQQEVDKGSIDTGEVAKQTAIGATVGGAVGGVSSVLEKKAAAKAAQVAADKLAADTAIWKKSAGKVVDLAEEASKDGVEVDAGQSRAAWINTLKPGEQAEFMKKAQPIIEDVGKKFGGSIKKLNPADALEYRDAVHQAMTDAKMPEEWTENVYEKITKDLQTKMKSEGYKGFQLNDNKIPRGQNITDLAAKAQSQPVSATPASIPVPAGTAPTIRQSVQKFAQQHPISAKAAVWATKKVPVVGKSLGALLQGYAAP